MAILLNKNSFEPSLEEMTHPVMALVIGLGVYTIELSHSFGQVSIGSFNDQVIVIVHQAIGMTDPVKTLVDCARVSRNKVRSLSFLKIALRSFPRAVT